MLRILEKSFQNYLHRGTFDLDTLNDVLKQAKDLPKTCWKHNAKDDALLIPFDGIPYIWLGRRHYQCHQDKDKAKIQKAK